MTTAFPTRRGRRLFVVADDYGIGPETLRGIRELLAEGSLDATVLLVNSPHAEADVRAWHRAGRPGVMGWHPCLTMDAPVAARVPALTERGGRLPSLGRFAAGLLLGRVRSRDIVTELDAQFGRFVELVGHAPQLVNGHKHVHAFPVVASALVEVLARRGVRPYVRRVRDAAACLRAVPGGLVKRLALSALGAASARTFDQAGLPGNDYLAGLTDPKWVDDPDFLVRWVAATPGRTVELMVHPGYRDDALLGRDCTAGDGQLERRVAELARLRDRASGRRAGRPASGSASRRRGCPVPRDPHPDRLVRLAWGMWWCSC